MDEILRNAFEKLGEAMPDIPGWHPDDLPHPDQIREQWQQCDAFLEKLLDGARQIAFTDPSHSFAQFVMFTDEHNNVRVRPFGATELTGLSTLPLNEEKVYVYRGGVLQPINTLVPEFSDEILGEFEELLNSKNASEKDFQRLFEKYPFFLTGLDFKRAHPQPILFQDEGRALIPDFFLEKLTSEWDAIVDLKRPYDEMITRRRNRVYFKQHVQNAIAQLRYYEEWFNSPINRKKFEDLYGIKTLRPKMVIVIGRAHHFRSDVERVMLLDGLPSKLELWTYDTLLNRAKSYINLCKGIKP